jgi:hypothetical protein
MSHALANTRARFRIRAQSYLIEYYYYFSSYKTHRQSFPRQLQLINFSAKQHIVSAALDFKGIRAKSAQNLWAIPHFSLIFLT